MTKDKILESSVQAKLIKDHKENGWLVIRLRSVDPAGYPDLLMIKNGKVKFIEVKKDTGTLSKLQIMRIEELRHHKINVSVVYGTKL
jgi:Holliday junction resolvase